MKKYLIAFLCSFYLFACNSKPNEKEITREERQELKKVESLKKTDKEKEDSVMAHWEKKMQESKVGE